MAVLPKWAKGESLGLNDPLAHRLAASQPLFSQLINDGGIAPDPFAKIAKAIAFGLSGKIAPKISDMSGMATKKQYKVPKGTTITVPRPHASLPLDRRDISAGQMIISKQEAVYDEHELLVNDDGWYAFKLPANTKEIPYIVVDHKRTMVIYIIELPGDLNEEIF